MLERKKTKTLHSLKRAMSSLKKKSEWEERRERKKRTERGNKKLIDKNRKKKKENSRPLYIKNIATQSNQTRNLFWNLSS